MLTANEGVGEGVSDDGRDSGAAGRSDGRTLQEHGVGAVDESTSAMQLEMSSCGGLYFPWRSNDQSWNY
jgi:hypothetical protein